MEPLRAIDSLKKLVLNTPFRLEEHALAQECLQFLDVIEQQLKPKEEAPKKEKKAKK